MTASETMVHASFRFYEELNDFLPLQRRRRDFQHAVSEARSIKDVVESLGVPHTEVDLILVNGRSVDFSHRLAEGDRVSVYPVFEALDITPVVRLRPRPLRVTRFVLDGHLGTLARYLRLLGFDTLYRNDYRDAELARVSVAEGRVLLTRDRRLLMRHIITHGYWVRATDPREQVREVCRRLDLAGSVRPFRRCLRCNGPLVPVAKAQITHRLLPKTRRYYDEFRICTGCERIYWRGSHCDPMERLVEELTREPGSVALPGAGDPGATADD